MRVEEVAAYLFIAVGLAAALFGLSEWWKGNLCDRSKR